MKKLFAFLCAMFVCVTMMAQKGQVAVGVNLGVAPCLEKGAGSVNNFGLGAKVSYGITDRLRGELDANYWFKSQEIDAVDVTVNLHYLFYVTEKFKIYPLVGVGFGSSSSPGVSISGNGLDIDFDITTVHSNSVVVNVGPGFEYDINDRFAAQLEVKFQYFKDFLRMPIQLGTVYKF